MPFARTNDTRASSSSSEQTLHGVLGMWQAAHSAVDLSMSPVQASLSKDRGAEASASSAFVDGAHHPMSGGMAYDNDLALAQHASSVLHLHNGGPLLSHSPIKVHCLNAVGAFEQSAAYLGQPSCA